jgi:excisionase family DNA binding protein
MAESLTTTQAGKILGVSGRRVYQMAARGDIEATRTEGGHFRIPIEAVEAELQRRRLRLLYDEQDRLVGMRSEPFQDPSIAAQREIGRLQGRLEAITEERDRLLRDLERERQRADQLQRELDLLKN